MDKSQKTWVLFIISLLGGGMETTAIGMDNGNHHYSSFLFFSF